MYNAMFLCITKKLNARSKLKYHKLKCYKLINYFMIPTLKLEDIFII